MTSQNFSYILFELAVTIGALLILYALNALKTMATKRFLAVLIAQYLFWISWDLLSVRLDVFRFPQEGNLPIRIAGLPLEEHLFFPFHSLLTWAIVIMAEAAKPHHR
jgi:lycopene cyclase domain-containing protein